MSIRIFNNQLTVLAIIFLLIGQSAIAEPTIDPDNKEAKRRYVVPATIMLRDNNGKLNFALEVELTVQTKRRSLVPPLLASGILTLLSGALGGLMGDIPDEAAKQARQEHKLPETMYWRPLFNELLGGNFLLGTADKVILIDPDRADKLRQTLKTAGALTMHYDDDFLSLREFEAGEPRIILVADHHNNIEGLFFKKDRLAKLWDLERDGVSDFELQEKPLYTGTKPLLHLDDEPLDLELKNPDTVTCDDGLELL